MSTKDRSSQGGPGTAGSASANEADDPSGDAGAGPAGSAGAPPIGVFALKVRAAWDETPTLRGLRLHGPSELLQQYHTPGQYLELVHGEAGSGYFAIAAAPLAGASPAADPLELELLVRRGPGLAGVLAGLQPEADVDAASIAAAGSAGAAGSSSAAGSSVSTSAAGSSVSASAAGSSVSISAAEASGSASAAGSSGSAGVAEASGSASSAGSSGSAGASGVARVAGASGAVSAAGAPAAESAQALRTQGIRGAGFALAAQAGRDLLLVAAGSGIAPLRAVLQRLLRQRQQFGHVALYYGERTESDFAYRGELEALRAAGVAVELVLSRPSAGWRGGVGYVQDQLRALPPPWLGPGTVALLCGQSGMISEVTALLAAHRVPPSQILMNY